ncbi:beta-glucosidase family protein [Coraliomargarita parva]|uniref:beta-glucosidase family protein n=1 Tax=Coraliomargarita parva TaxID=3014050 RepID=UPI0022B4AD66|nr:glycoside hydrolase family 3 C-terminal domain-containing protein [Coraliomargarita parva]
MSAEERFDLVCGIGFCIRGNERLGIPEVIMYDGGQGVNLRPGCDTGPLTQTVSFPCTQQLAATWNRQLARDYAQALGEECRAGGIHVLLAPGINIYRLSQCGRNFEYMGEDPYLTSEFTRIYVTAVQNEGVMATLKHFACNNVEFTRKHSDSRIGDRALNEIYLPAFKAGVEAGVLSVMTGYNQINGEYCGESYHVITELLRERLGFEHLVMSDWNSVTDGQKIAHSGQDLEMPMGAKLKESKEALLGSEQIDRMAMSILRTSLMMGFYDRDQSVPELVERLPAHEQTAYQTALEGIVLLRNENSTLPLKKDGAGKVLVTGNFASVSPLAGKGSGRVEGYNPLPFIDAFARKAGDAQVRYRLHPSDDEITSAETVIVCVGYDYEGEGEDRPFELPEKVEKQIQNLVDLNQRVIVVLCTGGAVRMNWHDQTAAIFQASFCGQRGAEALADLIWGDACPSGRLPYTMEVDFADSPDPDYVPEGLHVSDGRNNVQLPGQAKPPHFTGEWPHRVNYKEGSFVGYRWYAQQGIEPRYWFGHGLSYTQFEYSDLQVKAVDARTWEVSLEIRNVGPMDGAEVVQLYVEPLKPSPRQPMRVLKGFVKVYIAAGASCRARIYFDQDDFHIFDSEGCFQRPSNSEFHLCLGSDYQKIHLRERFDLPK